MWLLARGWLLRPSPAVPSHLTAAARPLLYSPGIAEDDDDAVYGIDGWTPSKLFRSAEGVMVLWLLTALLVGVLATAIQGGARRAVWRCNGLVCVLAAWSDGRLAARGVL